MDNKIILDEYQKAIIDIYHKEEIFGLSGLNGDYIIEGYQTLSWFYEVNEKGRIKYSTDFDFNKSFDELKLCSEEISFFLANMYLYRPYIDNPLKQGFIHDNVIIYPNYQNLYGKRYNMYIGVVGEKIYNYWDRIGDLIAAYFPGNINKRGIYFSTVINLLEKNYSNSENYIWLKSFYENNYKELNTIRKKFVHYHTHDTEFRYLHLDNATNRIEIERIVQERYNLADFYKDNLDLAKKGYIKTMLLIKEITAITIPED